MSLPSPLRLLGSLAGLVLAVLLVGAGAARADETVFACGPYADDVFASITNSGFTTMQRCGIPSGTLTIGSGVSSAASARAYWYATAPGGLTIDDATVDAMSAYNVNAPGSGYDGEFFWGPANGDGSSITQGQMGAGPFGVSYGTLGFPSPSFGFQMVCRNAQTCSANANISVAGAVLAVGETSGPSISAGGLWNHTGWVRGSWPIAIDGDSPSGVCSLSASVDGQQIASGSFPDDQTVWHQCNAAGAGGVTGAVNTAQFPNGSDTLAVADSDAAGLGNDAQEAIHVDNQAPTESLAGPSTASTAAGTQYVDESVGAGPSGVAGAECSVDGGPGSFYPGPSGSVPVSGLGPHTVTCTGQSNAVSSDGARATSAPASFGIDIQQPTVEGITFSHIADALRCRTTRRRIAIAGRRYVIHRDGHRIVVYSRSRHVIRRVRRCDAHTARRTVLLALRRHGRIVRHHGHIVRVRRTTRVIVLPHRVDLTHRRVGHGRATTVSGYLGLAAGTALAGQTVTVLGAPDDGHPAFSPVTTATTNADGEWVARIPAGSSRLLEAVYGGNAIDAAATSSTVALAVPARIALSISPRVLPWRDAMTVSGRLLGGHVPGDGVALRFLVRYPHSPQSSTLLALRTDRRGRFRFTWSYHAGRGVARYPFAVATTATESDYPFASASSPSITVTFGRPTPPPRRRR